MPIYCLYMYMYMYIVIYKYITHQTSMIHTDLKKGFVKLHVHPIWRNMHHSPTHKSYTFYILVISFPNHLWKLLFTRHLVLHVKHWGIVNCVVERNYLQYLQKYLNTSKMIYAKDWQYSNLHSCYMYISLTTVHVKKNTNIYIFGICMH